MNEVVYEIGDGPDIQLAHANAYTPGCYRKFCHQLKVGACYLPFQRPLWPNEDPMKLKSWHTLADDLIKHMDARNRKDIVGIGHSMGGVASWIAAVKRPDLFRQLILIDPVILPAKWVRTMHLLPMSLKKKYFPVVKIASRRRSAWPDRETARKYFLSKRVFRKFDDDVLADFVDTGLVEYDEGVKLAYSGKWESRIYATPPNLWKMMSKNPCPITIIRAEHSDVISDERWEMIHEKMPHAHLIQMDGAHHLVPFESPGMCAEVVNQILNGQS